LSDRAESNRRAIEVAPGDWLSRDNCFEDVSRDGVGARELVRGVEVLADEPD
jgi:hypothetical protein